MLNNTIAVLEPSAQGLVDLWGLSRAGVALFNAALAARLEAREAGRRETRATQIAGLPELCRQAGIDAGALPHSVAVNLLSALNAAIFGARDWRPRDQQKFWPLCWSARDIKSSWSRLTLESLPSLRLPLPWLYAGQGEAVKVTISQNWSSGQFSATIEWSPGDPGWLMSYVPRIQYTNCKLHPVYGICTLAKLRPST